MTTEWDYALCALLIVYSLISAMTLMLLEKYRRSHKSFPYRQPFHLYGLMVFGLIGSWASFVANNQMNEFVVLMDEGWSCSLWNYWLLHVVGINMWIVFMYLRMFDRFMVFSPRLRRLTPLRQDLARLSIIFAMSTIPIVIAANITWGNLSTYSQEDNTCTSPLLARLILMGWYVICILGFRVMFKLLERYIFTMDVRDYWSLMDIWTTAVVVFIINACINVSGIESEWYGRVPYTFNVACLFCFTVYRLCGHILWHNIRVHMCGRLPVPPAKTIAGSIDKHVGRPIIQQDYAHRQPYDDVPHFNRMLQLSELMFKSYTVFALYYLRKEPPNPNSTRLEVFNKLLWCHAELVQFRYNFVDVPESKAKNIVASYFAPDCTFPLDLPDRALEIIRGDLDNPINLAYGFKTIMSKLKTEFYGTLFLQMINEYRDEFFAALSQRKQLEGDPIEPIVPVQNRKDNEPNSLELNLMSRLSPTTTTTVNDENEEEEEEEDDDDTPPPLQKSPSTEQVNNFLRLNNHTPTNEGRSWLRHLHLPGPLRALGGSFQPNKTKFENL